MQTHDDSNNEVIGYAVKKVAAGIGEVLKERWQEEYGENWAESVNSQLRPPERKVNIHDPVFYFKGIIGTWHLFKKDFSPDLLNLAFRLLGKRHIWAHNNPIDDDQTIYALYQCEEMLDLLNCAFEYRDTIKKGRDNFIINTFGPPIHVTTASKEPDLKVENEAAKTQSTDSPKVPESVPSSDTTVIKRVEPSQVVRASLDNIELGSHVRVVLTNVDNFENSRGLSWMWEFQTLNNRPEIDGLNIKAWTNISPKPNFHGLTQYFKSLGDERTIADLKQIIEQGEPPSSLVGLTAIATVDYPDGWYYAKKNNEEYTGSKTRAGKPYLNIIDLHPDDN